LSYTRSGPCVSRIAAAEARVAPSGARVAPSGPRVATSGRPGSVEPDARRTWSSTWPEVPSGRSDVVAGRLRLGDRLPELVGVELRSAHQDVQVVEAVADRLERRILVRRALRQSPRGSPAMRLGEGTFRGVRLSPGVRGRVGFVFLDDGAGTGGVGGCPFLRRSEEHT